MGATGSTAGNAAKYVIALDQGTTSSRAALIDREGRMVDCVQRPFQQIFPQPGWVEHNPQEILFSQLGCLTELIARHGLCAGDDVFRRERDEAWAKERLDGWHEAVRRTIW